MTRAIFLHGFGADRLTWAGTTPAIRGIDAVTPDLPGHGNAVGDLGDGSLGDMTSRLVAGFGEGPPAWLVGHSLGGGLALTLTARSPQRFRGLVLLAPMGLGRGFDHEALARYSGIRDRHEMRTFLEGLVVRKGVVAQAFVDTALGQRERHGARDAMARIANRLPTMEAEVASALPEVAESGLDITVIWGAEDRVASPDRNRIKTLGTLVALAGTGHIAHVEARKRVNAVLADRLAGPR